MTKMNPFLKVFLSYCWTNMYLIIGLCLGLSISLLLVPMDSSNDMKYHKPLLPLLSELSNSLEDIDEYEPKINTDSKPRQAQKVPKAFVRPRYYSTELGIKEKLFVGVLTNTEFLHSRDLALNKTLAHLVDTMRYFISIPEGTKPNVSLPGIVGFTDTRVVLKPFHALKYITDNYLEDYDYYFFIKDTTYVNARRLMELVKRISVSQNIHMGVLRNDSPYCLLDAGILLSSWVIQQLKSNLDWCVKNAYSDLDDVNFGRCIVHSASIPCKSKSHEQIFLSTNMGPNFHFENDLSHLVEGKEFEKSVTVFPVYDCRIMYKLNSYFATIRLIEVQKEIFHLRTAIKGTSHLGPVNERDVPWPIGNRPGNKPLGRFDVLRWIYFNETHTFLENDFSNIKEWKTDAKLDLQRILQASINRILYKNDNKLRFKSLSNGYRRFDASRGMDYIFDLVFIDVESKKELNKRVEACKPLGKVEILPVPYVTENTRVNLILTVDLMNKKDALEFMDRYAQECMQKKQKTFLMMVLLYNFSSLSKGEEDIFYDVKKYASILSNKYKKDQSKIAWLSIRLPSIISAIEMEPMLKIAIADLCTRKFSVESLILFAQTRMDLKIDYLNRVRMNTINRYQVFSPIPFVEFHPDIVYNDEAMHTELDINHNYGRYDDYNYDSISFYVKDYNAMRRTVESSIPLARSDRDIPILLKESRYSSICSLYEMFVSFTDLHVFRAVEPALKIRYKEINCTGTGDNEAYNLCMKRRLYSLGRRGQLTKLLLDYQYHERQSP